MRIQVINSVPFTAKNTTYKKNARTFNSNQAVKYDTVDFKGKNNKKRYEKQVEQAYSNQANIKTTLHTDDIKYLLDMDDNEFKDVITKPVKINLYDKKHKFIRHDLSNILFHTDAKATELLIKKLDDEAALMEVLSTTKSGSFGYTVMHYAAINDDVDKIKAIKNGLPLNDFKSLIDQKDDLDDDTPYELAISSGNKAIKYLKKYI